MNTTLERILISDGFRVLKSDIQELRMYILRTEKMTRIIIICDIDENDIDVQMLDKLIRNINGSYELFNTKDISCNTFLFTQDLSKASGLCHGLNSKDERFAILLPDNELVLLDYQTEPLSEFATYISNRLDGIEVKPVIKNSRNDFKYVTLVNILIIIVNVVIFILLEMGGSTQNAQYLLERGGEYWKSVLYDHEYYRMFTAMFMHAGIEHLAGNMFSLFFVGGFVEKYVGKVKYIILYFGSGILAGVTSVIYNMSIDSETVCVGASGAIYGIVGTMLAILVLDKNIRRTMGIKGLMVYIVLSLTSGISSWGIDNAAHVGGFVSGFICAVVLLTLFPRKEKRCKDAS